MRIQSGTFAIGLVKVIKNKRFQGGHVRNQEHQQPCSFSISRDFWGDAQMPKVVAYRFLTGPELLVWP